jgi:hypothetical protein
MNSHSNHDFHDDLETREFRHRDRRRQRDSYDRREWKRISYEEEERDETSELRSPPESTSGNSLLILQVLLAVSIVMSAGFLHVFFR